MLAPKNWATFQHYKDRNPPWIKLHKGLLDDYEFQCLPVASRALAPCLWLLASEYPDGVITLTEDALQFRLRMTLDELVDAIQPLVNAGFFSCDSALLATGKRSAMPEESREETETEKNNIPSAVAPVKPKREPKVRVLGGWPEELNLAMKTWRDLRRELLSEEILGKFPNDPDGHYVAQVGTKGKAWEAWQKRRGVVTPEGVKVTDAHIQAAVRMWAETRYRLAKSGKNLSMPNLSSLINSADFEDALLRVAAPELARAN